MTLTKITLAAMLAAVPALPALAEDKPNTDIVSSAPEGSESCDDLKDSLEAKREDNILTPADLREMRDKGC